MSIRGQNNNDVGNLGQDNEVGIRKQDNKAKIKRSNNKKATKQGAKACHTRAQQLLHCIFFLTACSNLFLTFSSLKSMIDS